MPDPIDEALWRERLCRALNINAACGPMLDTKEGRDAAHELLEVLATSSKFASREEWEAEAERVGEVVRQHRRRVEDKHAARLGLPSRPA